MPGFPWPGGNGTQAGTAKTLLATNGPTMFATQIHAVVGYGSS